MSLRTPLGTALAHGSARQGTEHFWGQTVSAIALVPLLLWFGISLIGVSLGDRASVAAWVAYGWHPVLLVLLVLSLTWHSQLGIQMILEDYVHGPATKITALLASRFLHALLAAGAIYSILRVAILRP